MKNYAPLIRPDKSALEALKALLAGKDRQKAVRVDLCFNGCCDPALEIRLDEEKTGDLICEHEGIHFIMSPETHEIAGEVTMTYISEGQQEGFRLTSSRPVSEWEGFGVCQLKA